MTLPPHLIELELGSKYSHPLLLSQRLKRLVFHWNSRFDLPLALPASLVSIHFGNRYNQPTILPLGIEEIRVGRSFTHDLSLPSSLRTIEWACNRPLQIPDGVCEVNFGSNFNRVVVLPHNLKKAAFHALTYSHPLSLPPGLEDLTWCPLEYDGLVLPAGLRKLTWSSRRHVGLPSGLRVLTIYLRAFKKSLGQQDLHLKKYSPILLLCST